MSNFLCIMWYCPLKFLRLHAGVKYFLIFKMDLEEFFEDDDEEMFNFIANIRTYTVRDRVDHFNKWDDKEFSRRFRLKKATVMTVLNQIADMLNGEAERYL